MARRGSGSLKVSRSRLTPQVSPHPETVAIVPSVGSVLASFIADTPGLPTGNGGVTFTTAMS